MSDLRRSLNLLWLSFIAIYIVSLVTSLTFFYFLNALHHKNLAASFAMSARNSIAINDLRQAVMTLSPAVVENFEGLELNVNGQMVFALPAQSVVDAKKANPFVSEYRVPMLQDPAQAAAGKIGDLIFYYNSAAPLLLGLAAWLSLLIFAYPLFRLVRGRIEKRHQELVQLNSAEAARAIAKQVAHDIRSPVTALNMILQKNSPFGKDERGLLAMAAERISQIADDLLRQEREQRPPDKVSLQEVLSKVLIEKRPTWPPGLELNVDVDSAAEVYVLANSALLARMLANLLQNAVEASGERGSIRVTLQKNGEAIELSIVDQGMGISEDNLKKIGEAGFSTKPNGNGLGLSSSIRALKSWGGDLKISSALGAGTQVTLRFLPAPAAPARVPPSFR